ncbi:hypothetical protein [Rehaibacterium terrae]|uniref:Type II secretory pathway pseudopilin PulG n=1 Tax=Rehaibacterium terrae TaxID=1341696 RepID=A0A7W7XZ85_9GAMM|nr:hypothetical protein [Rehaibacterium terrae]MBB5015189.1 type II secretory pathway pseudopilin PulG [Rehaibacterium terrae]
MAVTSVVHLPQRIIRSNRRVRGTVLLVVIVLLLLASLFVLLGLNVSVFEQRTSGNDLRARLAQELADAGLTQGIEFFNARRDLVLNGERWTLCGPNETEFPCGAVPAARRGTMFKYHAPGTTGAILADRLLPLDAPITSIGGFDASQQVGAVLCRVAPPAGPGAPTTCATDLASASPTWAITVVSRGQLTNEGSSATVTQTFGGFNLFAMGPNAPPVVASGTVTVGGALSIVAAQLPQGPVSVWTRLAVEKNGTPRTCQFHAFLRQGGSGNSSDLPRVEQGTEICHSCRCPGDDSLSFPKAGNEACQGSDIVDIDNNAPNSPGCPVEPNLDIRREEFPKDLFAFVFGQRAWDDIERDGIPPGSPCTYEAKDCHFGETRRVSLCTYPHPATGALTTALLPEDTCFLLNIRNKIHIGDGIDDQAQCDALGPSTRGLVWVHSQPIGDLPGYTCGRIRQIEIGSPTGPVALIHDGALTQVNGLILYGLLFLREPNGNLTLDKNTGGTADFGINGNAIVYGAVVVQGKVTSGGGGNAAIVYKGDVLSALVNDPSNFNTSSLPASWTDRLRY